MNSCIFCDNSVPELTLLRARRSLDPLLQLCLQERTNLPPLDSVLSLQSTLLAGRSWDTAVLLLSLTIARFPPDFVRDVAISIWSLWLPYPGGGLFCKNAFSDIAVFKGTRDKINIFGDLSHSKSLILDLFFLSLTQT